ncbi:unnamed protein product [Peronospora belbahrii]|uniref:Uncharacterized protein n=1 Tax=Peronospora belbahrii TaxID=622444 RepID=A0AAU9KG95_9STRA|nr:unnamed protein product [Peronospora belbahrii]CAH0519456.1 unnamed protein product [Peronospora belbahrii]
MPESGYAVHREASGKLLAGANALFWLNVLQPMVHPACLSRQEVREVLLLLLEELRNADGVYEELMKKNERFWDLLRLPLKLEPLYQGVSTLALCGHEIAANEALQLLAVFAKQNTVFCKQKRATPMGLSIVTSVGLLAPLEISIARELPKAFCEPLSQPFIKLIRDWHMVVDEVLDILGKFLAGKWVSCEQASLEKIVQQHR